MRHSPALRSSIVVILAIAQEPADLLRVATTQVGPGLPTGWEVQRVRGETPPLTDVREGPEGRLLRIEGKGNAAWFYNTLTRPIAEGPGQLRWSWRVIASPSNADLRRADADDSPIRVFVMFGKRDMVGRPGRMIFYSFGGREPAGYSGPSHATSRAHVFNRGGPADNGTWLDHASDPFTDYRAVWRTVPPAITAVGIMQDSDQTYEQASAELRRLEWSPTYGTSR